MNGNTKRKTKKVIDDEKEAYRLFWLVKGHLDTSHETIISSYDGYFKRLWGNCERAEYGMEGFEEAYKKKRG